MTKLSEMSYEEFGKLRFLNFFPRTERYVEEHEGGLESGIGNSCFEGYGYETAFMSRDASMSDEAPEWQTAEIQLTFDHSQCPETEGNALLSQLGLNIRKAMSPTEAKETLGKTELVLIDEKSGDAEKQIPCCLRFVAGKEWPYYVTCWMMGSEGLIKVWICRKDWADEVESVR